MKDIYRFSILIIGVLLSSNSVLADCKMEKMTSCYRIEKNKSDSSRYGATASAFCAAQAVAECSSNSSNYTPKLGNISDCSKLAERSGNWNSAVFDKCMGN